jgi:SecD/SecF fusion protein
MNDPNRLYKWLLIVMLVAFATLTIWPPDQKLKGGIDLVGGTSLLFEIDTSGLEGSEQRDLASRVMEILKARVDPGARLNLEWRPIGNSRLEIRMPRPPAKALERRELLDDARAKVTAMNISRFDIESALNAPEAERQAALDALVRGVPEREALIEVLVDARAAYTAAQESGNIETVDTARAAYEDAMRELVHTTLSLGRLNDVLAVDKEAKREEELRKLREQFPAYDAASNGQPITETVQAYDAWAEYKADLEDPSDLKRRIRGAGVLEFRILAERDPRSPSKTYVEGDPTLSQDIGKYKEQLAQYGPRVRAGDRYQWFPTDDVLDFMNVDSMEALDEVIDQPGRPIVDSYAGEWFVLGHADDRFGLLAPRGSSKRWKLQSAFPDRDPMTGQSVVSFRLDPRGGAMFGELTSQNIGRQLCIFLDGQAVSHATIRSQIFQSGQISGTFTPEEVRHLVRSLEAGALPARLKPEPLMEKTIGPSLGETNRTKGMQAAFIGFAAVVVFMLIYYGFAAGGMADLALVLNLLLILAVMALTQATFTLPGIAGVILTVGMAIDANVLIFERIREERDRGLGFRKALNAGYDKAFSTIFDANLTTLITCIVLGFMGSEEVKGFATTLGIGIVTSMFTALFVTRLIFNSLIGAGVLKDLRMKRLISVPQIDWLSLRQRFWPVSLVLVILGAGFFAFLSAADTEAVYDIEFLGGTNVQVDLREGVNLTDVQVRAQVTQSEAAEGVTAVGWLNDAADKLEQAEVKSGASAGEVAITSETLTGEDIEALMHRVTEPVIERNGIYTEGHTANFIVKPGAATVEDFQGLVTQASRRAREAADNLRNARVQSVKDLAAEGGAATAFDIVTVETDRELVQRSVLAALGDKVEAQRALAYTLARDAEYTMAPYFIIDQDHEYLSDVIHQDANYDVRRYKGGVAMEFTLDAQETPLTVAELEARLREVRLLPEFEATDARESAVFPLGDSVETPEGERAYRHFAVAVYDPNLRYADDRVQWEDSLAKVELAQLETALGREKSLSSVTQFAPSVAEGVKRQAAFAVFVALGAIVVYVRLRFGTLHFGLAAIVALVHDVSITLGAVTLSHFLYDTWFGAIFGLTDFKIDLAMVAAILTVIGYSLNDTIVVFDRIRENRGRIGSLSPALINQSLNQTLSRTLLTSVTTFLVVLILYVVGGEGVHGFAFALLFGVVVGTYSSIGIATPLLYRPKLLVRVVLIIALLGAIGIIFVVAHGTPTRLVLIALAVAGFFWMLFKARQAEAAASGGPQAQAQAKPA